jgi:hypothetical protein
LKFERDLEFAGDENRFTGTRLNRDAGLLRRSEPLRPQQRVGQVKQQACGDDAGERVIEDHGYVPSIGFAGHVRRTREILKSFAGIGVADGNRKEAEAKGQHDDVQHGILPVALARVTMARGRKGGLRRNNMESARNPALGRVSGPDVPLDAYVFEAIGAATL